MENESSDYEAQLDAMRKVMEAIKPLEKGARLAVLDWVDIQVGRETSNKQNAPAVRGQHKSNEDREIHTRPGTVSTAAQKLGANSCRSLFSAAAAFLSIYRGKESFTRDELIACAKEARGWKVEYSNQMATTISRMLDSGTLFEKAKDVFSLSDSALKEMEGKLAQ